MGASRGARSLQFRVLLAKPHRPAVCDFKFDSWPHTHHTDRRLGVLGGHAEFVQKIQGDSGNCCVPTLRAVTEDYLPGETAGRVAVKSHRFASGAIAVTTT